MREHGRERETTGDHRGRALILPPESKNKEEAGNGRQQETTGDNRGQIPIRRVLRDGGPWGAGGLGGWGPALLARCIAWQGLGPGTEFGVQLLLWPVVLVRNIALPPIRPRSPRVV